MIHPLSTLAVRMVRSLTKIENILASAIYDSENTARLEEHPEELQYYLDKAIALLHHMRVLGITVKEISKI